MGGRKIFLVFIATCITYSIALENDLESNNDQIGFTTYVLGDDRTGYCQLYRGSACIKFLWNRTVHVISINSQAYIEEKLTAAFTVMAASSDLSRRCAEYAIPSLCYSAFPLCNENTSFPQPRQVCREECEILEYDICRMEYSIAKRHPLIGQQLALPDCSELPPIGTVQSENCIRLGVPQPAQIKRDDVCFSGNGVTYRGMESRTASGFECQQWSHQINMKTSEHPELIGGHNFCRNPGGVESQPWCYTTGGENVRKDVCGISKCGKSCNLKLKSTVDLSMTIRIKVFNGNTG